MSRKILLVDDDTGLVESLARSSRETVRRAAASSGADGLKALLGERPDLVILDVMMETTPPGSRPPTRSAAAARRPDTASSGTSPSSFLRHRSVTNSRSPWTSGELSPGTNEFMTKPVDIDELLAKIARALK